MNELRLSAAPYRTAPERPLTDQERQTLMAVADALIPDGAAGPRPSRLQDYGVLVDRALAARGDCFESITELLRTLSGFPSEDLTDTLRRLATEPGSGFEPLSAVVAGAYLMAPEVREAIGYPGQAQRPPRFDEAADEIMTGILDPVIARGHIYRPAAEAESSGVARSSA